MTTTRRLLVTREEAAEMLGVSLSTFDRTIRPHLRVVHIGKGRTVKIPISEVERWVDANATRIGA